MTMILKLGAGSGEMIHKDSKGNETHRQAVNWNQKGERVMVKTFVDARLYGSARKGK